MDKEKQSVEIYRTSAYHKENGRLLKRWIYQSKKAFLAQSKRRRYYRNFYKIVCEVLNSDNVFEEIKDE